MENTSVMDDELVLDQERNYLIVYSRSEDRPHNATPENGVTWVNWGQTCTQALTLRWISVVPDWAFALSPHEQNLPWAKSTWSGTQHDPSLIGQNHPKGFLKAYHPVKHYMKKTDFEALGNGFGRKDLPAWIAREGNGL
ncbi:MAG: hypothetical protein HC913_07680 [Microscillaceae bacterium]|nr:hypothetical protein [Microscillaceae bacterium]